MNWTRWKLLAGVFGLSVCGLAALAEPACRTTGHGHSRQVPPLPEAQPQPKGGSVSPPPIPVAPPKPAEIQPAPAPAPLPAIPPSNDLLTPPAPVLDRPIVAIPLAVSKPGLAEPVELALPVVKDEKPKPEALGLPTFPMPAGSQLPNIPGSTAVPAPTPVTELGLPPLPGAKPVELPALPGVRPNGVVQLPDLEPQSALPNPGLQSGTKPLVPVNEPRAPQLPPPPPVMQLPATTPTTPPPSQELRPVESRAASPTVEKRLRVTLLMGEGNPRFEIRDGEEVVLKVTSDKVDVKAPTEKGDLWSTLKASGRVKFQSPGGDGYCEELQIVPGTCEVVATGKVQFKYNWGKVETAVTSERMTFRLGATPGQ